MLQISQQQRALIEQRLRCINRAKSFTELEECQRANSAGWNHGPGMGGWGCPMW
jgi:N-glycosylase/DNA lyase